MGWQRTSVAWALVSLLLAGSLERVQAVDSWDDGRGLLPFELSISGEERVEYGELRLSRVMEVKDRYHGSTMSFQFQGDGVAKYVPAQAGSSTRLAIYVLTDRSFELRDGDEIAIKFDQHGRLIGLKLSSEYHLPPVQFGYAEALTEGLVQIPYRLHPIGDRKVKFLNAFIPETIEVLNAHTQSATVLTFNSETEPVGYFPEEPARSPFKRLAIMTDGSFLLHMTSGLRLAFDGGGEFQEMTIRDKPDVVSSLRVGEDTVTFQYAMSDRSGLRVLQATTSDKLASIDPFDHVTLGAAPLPAPMISLGPSLAIALNHVGSLYQDLGRLSVAKQLYSSALALVPQDRRQQSGAIASVLLNNLGTALHDSGHLDKARAFYQQAYDRANGLKVDWPRVLRVSRNNLADALIDTREYEQAGALFQQAEEARPANKDHAEIAQTIARLNRAGLHERIKDTGQSAALYTRIVNSPIFKEQRPPIHAWSRWDSPGGPLRVRVDMVGLGRFLFEQKRYEEALQIYRDSATALAKTKLDDRLLVATVGVGQTLLRLKQPQQAEAYFQSAVDITRDQWRLLPPHQRTAFLSQLLGAKTSRLDAYEGLITVKQQLGNTAEAFYWSEHTKAALLAEALTQGKAVQNIPAGMAQQEARVLREFSAELDQHTRSYEAGLTDGRGGTLPARKRFEDFLNELRRHYPAYVTLKYGEPLAINDLFVRPEEAVITFEVTAEAVYGWLIKRKQVQKAVTIPITREALTEKVTRLRASLNNVSTYADLAKFDVQGAHDLYTLLLKDFQPWLKGQDRIILVPDEILGVLPFGILIPNLPQPLVMKTGAYGPYPANVIYLDDVLAPTYAQSATALSLARLFPKETIGNKVLVVADPVFGLSDDTRTHQTADASNVLGGEQLALMRAVSQEWKGQATADLSFRRLPETGRLAESMKSMYKGRADVLTGFDASEEKLRGLDLRQYKYQIFATHGILNGNIPTFQEPALVLAQVGSDLNRKTRDGFLTLSEVARLTVNAELVALTACDTGVGTVLTGEGVLGLGWAFQVAGARSVLMSLWSVEDKSTNLLTERLFTHLEAGQAKWKALRMAQADLRNAGYHHPFFWGAFSLVGEP